MTKSELGTYFTGEKNWKNFVEVHKPNWSSCKFKDELVRRLNGHEDLAIAVFGAVEGDSLKWISEKVPAMGGKETPEQAARSEDGIKSLKTLLMRMPS